MNNPIADSYDRTPSKRLRISYNPAYSNAYEEVPTGNSWNNVQYYPTQSDDYYNRSSEQYQSSFSYNPTSNYNQSNRMSDIRIGFNFSNLFFLSFEQISYPKIHFYRITVHEKSVLFHFIIHCALFVDSHPPSYPTYPY